jgi:hypothetical protein
LLLWSSGLLINFTLIAKTRLKDCSGHKNALINLVDRRSVALEQSETLRKGQVMD